MNFMSYIMNLKFGFVICIITQSNFIVNSINTKINCMLGVLKMKFGEKVKEQREKNRLTQPELAKLLGVSTRTIASYESCNSYPRHQETYEKLAEILGVSVDYLKTERESFMTDVGDKYGRRGQIQAQAILEQAAQLFAGGTLSEDEELAFVMDVHKLFLDSKERAKKYTPKKYLSEETNDQE